MVKRWAFAASVLFVSLTLMPAGAHLLALPNKIAMSGAEYLAAQQAYRGWALAGAFVIAAIVATAVLGWASRKARGESRPAIAALICLVLSQVVFWTLNFPANDETGNWTSLPANWQVLRLRWEIGHAIGALLALAALIALLLAFVRRDARITSRTTPYAAMP
jgi:hypothetical protein